MNVPSVAVTGSLLVATVAVDVIRWRRLTRRQVLTAPAGIVVRAPVMLAVNLALQLGVQALLWVLLALEAYELAVQGAGLIRWLSRRRASRVS
jgi:hypothetical protein